MAATTSTREMDRKEHYFRNWFISGVGITACRVALLWDQQDAQLEQVHPWSLTAYPLKIKDDAYPYTPAFCYKLKSFSNSVMSVLLLRKILECLGSGALAYPRLNSAEEAGSRDRP